MKRLSIPRFVLGLAVMCSLLIAVSAFAQFQTGNIYGKVQAKDGSVLPGVTVTLTGVGAPQTQVTDAQGNFRFVNLSPGTYTIKAELAGYGVASRTGIGVRVNSNADVVMTMNPSVQESITVTAEAPLLDTRKTGSSTNVAKVELEKVPQARDPWSVLQTTASVMVDRINVGGTQSGQQSNYIAKGALGRDNSWNMDGVNITDMGATGSSPLYFDFDSFEELQISIGGADPRIFTPGVQLNMVTKRGTNDFKGSGRYMYTPGSTSSDPTVPKEATSYLVHTNQVNFVRDNGAEIGGPILKDRLWFWGARGDQKISAWQSQGYNAPVAPATEGTPQFSIPDNTVLRDKNFKLNGQIISSNSAVAFYTFGDKVRNARDLSPTRPYETSYHQAGPTKVYKLEDTQIIGSSLYLTGMWSKVEGGFGLHANGGSGEGAPSRWRDSNGVNHDGYFTYDTVRPQKQYRLDGSKFFDIGTMNHELKFGFGYRKTPVNSTSSLPGPSHGWWDYSSSTITPARCAALGLASNCGLATLPRDVAVGYDEKYRDMYLGDTILLGNLTIQAGLRWDNQRTMNTPVSVAANPILASPITLPCVKSTLSICTGTGTNALLGAPVTAAIPGLTYAGDPKWLKWNSVTPRIGATYALGSNKRTLVRAQYNRYAGQLGSAVSGANPLAYSAWYIYGVDTNNNHTIDRSELQILKNFTGLNASNPTAPAITRRVDYGMKVPTTDEFLIGIERELLSDFAVGLNYTYRKYNDLYWTNFEKTQGKGDFYTIADYVPATVTVDGVVRPVVAGGTFMLCRGANGASPAPVRDANSNFACPAGSSMVTTFQTGTRPVYALAPGVANPTYRVLTTRPDYSQRFSGIELTATKRMSHNWMLRTNVSWNDYTEKCGSSAFRNPTPVLGQSNASNNCAGGQLAPQSAGSGAFGNDFINSKWNVNVTSAVQLPWDFNVGASLTARQGYPAVLRDNVTGLPGGTSAVILDPVGDVRFDNVYELDLRVAKDFRFMNRVGFTVSADLFNAPNKRTVLQRETLIMAQGSYVDATGRTVSNATVRNPRTAGWRITEMQAPRVWRVGGKFTF
jgi:hypothetical protein